MLDPLAEDLGRDVRVLRGVAPHASSASLERLGLGRGGALEQASTGLDTLPAMFFEQLLALVFEEIHGG